MLLVTDGEVLHALDFGDCESRMHKLLRLHHGNYTLAPGRSPKQITRCIREYFDGNLTALDDVRAQTGGSPFQRRVWEALREIAPGNTTSYGQLADRIGRPGSAWPATINLSGVLQRVDGLVCSVANYRRVQPAAHSSDLM